MEIGLQKSVRPRQASVDLDRLIESYRLGDSAPAHAFVATLSPDLLRFFRSQVASRQQAADPLREPWMRNHRVRHTYRPGDHRDCRLQSAIDRTLVGKDPVHAIVRTLIHAIQKV